MRKLIKEADPDVVEEWEVDGHSGLVARRHHLHWRMAPKKVVMASETFEEKRSPRDSAPEQVWHGAGSVNSGNCRITIHSIRTRFGGSA